MKLLIVLSLFSLFISCNQENVLKNKKEVVKAQENKKFSPPSPEKMAIEFLNAYKIKDLQKVKSLSMRMVSMNFTKENFDDKVVEILKKWDGTVNNIKYTYGMGQIFAGIIPFGDVDEDTIHALSLSYLRGKWIFGLGGFRKIKKETYKDYVEKLFDQKEVSKHIVGNWKCIKDSFRGKPEPKDVIEQKEYIFNQDGTVILKNVGVVSKGEYKIENNLILISRIKKVDPENRKYVSKETSLIFKDQTTIIKSNDTAFTVYNKQ